MSDIRRAVACILVSVLTLAPSAQAQPAPGPEIWRSFVERLDPGTTLRIRLTDGQRFKATLLQSTPDGLTVQPRTRAAVPPQRVPFDQIATLEVDRDKGIGIGKAIAIGAGVGAGVWLALMAFAFAVIGD